MQLQIFVWCFFVLASGRSDDQSQQSDQLILNTTETNIHHAMFISLLKVKKLWIGNSRVNHVDDGALCSSPFKEIQLYRNKHFANFSKKYFGNCESLEILTLIGNNMILEKDAFSTITKLLQLTLMEQPIRRLTQQYFRALTSLEVLKLVDCNIREIDRGAFDNLENLQELEIRGNEIKRIDGVLVYLFDLRNLTIIEKLSHFPWDDLLNSAGLEYISISDTINGYELDKIATYAPHLKRISLPKYEQCHMVEDMKDKLRSKIKNITFEDPSCVQSIASLPDLVHHFFIVLICYQLML